MAKLKKAVSWRSIERPYTRKSRLRKLNYVKASPNSHIVRFDMGDAAKEFPHKLVLKSKSALQIRHNALEAGRKSANSFMEKKAGKNTYHLRMRIYPHHILRENPMATGAGADRTSEGMKRAFGKAIGLAAQVDEGQVILEINCEEKHMRLARKALKRFSHKIPCSCRIIQEK